MDPALNKNETEFGVLVLSVRLKMLANGNRLFDEVPKVLRDGWAKSYPQTKGKESDTQIIGGGKKKQATALMKVEARDDSRRTVALENTENLVSRHKTDLGNTVAVPQDDTNLGWGKTLPGKLHDVVDNILRCRL